MAIIFNFLEEVKDVNSFVEVPRLKLIKGNAQTIYFRLVQDRSGVEEHLAQLRYVPASGATMSVKFNHIDSNKVLTRTATLAFSPDDRSIWKVDVLATDKDIAFDSMEVTLTEGALVRSIPAGSDLLVEDTGSGRFFC